MDAATQSCALAELAGLLADRTRATFCVALLDGRAWTAGELARAAGVAPSTASEHIDRLVAGGLVREHRQGRHRYLALASAETAELLEDLLARVTPVAERPRTLRDVETRQALAGARTCYDHIAGRLGVAITDALSAHGLLDRQGGAALTEAGAAWLARELEVDVEALRAGRRPLVRLCVDWTERRPHLAGAAGAALCARVLERGWVQRIGTGRALRVTREGARALDALLGVDASALAGR
jgi:DNA-binding transcriptional ArsR family regulator